MALISSGVCGEKFGSVREIQTPATIATYKVLEIMLVLDPNGQLSTLVDECEWLVFLILLDICIIEVATNQT